MTFSKALIVKFAHIALMGGLALSTQACAKKSFEALNKDNNITGANGGSGGNSGGSNNGGSNNAGTNSGGSNNGGTNNGGSNNGGSNNGSTNGSNNGGSNNGSTNGSNNGGSNNGSTNGSTSGGSNNGGCNPFDPSCVPIGKFCVTEKYQQPSAVITRKLDVWIVTDTSASMDDEREALANGITNYIAQLPSNVDVQFAVSLAHGPTSWFSGRMYKSDFASGAPEKYVISSKDYSNSEIRSWIRRKLLYSQCQTFSNGTQDCYKYAYRSFDNSGNLTAKGFRTLPQDFDSSGGEAGLYTVYEAIRPYPGETPRYTSIQNLGTDIPGDRGFFREDAALAIIFISDENDICTVDTDPGSHNDPQGKEAAFRNAYCIPKGVNAASVLQRLQVVRKSLPLYVSSIIYNTRSKVPAGLENGVGYGYNTITSMAGGTIIDITSQSIPAGLSTIGSHASTRLDLRYDFILKYLNVDSSTIQAKVDNTVRSHAYSSTTNTVHLSYAGGANSKVDIYYCLKAKEKLQPYNISISNHLINTSSKTYQPNVVVEEK